jgi:NAD(P)-dependent dehydrogenase (short-subunit alcohol dehydrogenase family)
MRARESMNTDRVVLVTGAAGGIGALLVERFLGNGDTVLATDLSSDMLAQAHSAWGWTNRVLLQAGDVASEEDCARLAGIARDLVGRIDVLVNCAGYYPRRPFEQITPNEWRRIVDINLTGVFLMTQAMLPLMKGRGWGRIINFGSGTMFSGTPDTAHYVSAKAGLLGLTRCMSTEFGQYGITANLITPGLTLTAPVLRDLPPEVRAAAAEQRSIKRDMLPEDLVGPVLFLASPAADFVTGQLLNVDGGSTKH